MALLCLVYSSCDVSGNETVVNQKSNTSPVKPQTATLNISNLKGLNAYSDLDIKIKFGQFIFQKTYIHDRYQGQYVYNSAERGDIYITSSILIDSKSKDPALPIICAFIWNGKSLEMRGSFDYNLSYWQDYGMYLGNNPDWNNDFAHTEKIRFDIGLEVEKNNIKGYPLYIMALNSPCVTREEDRFKQPVVKYNDGSCITGGDIESLDQLKNFTLIKIINEPKLNKKLASNLNKYGGVDYGFISKKYKTIEKKVIPLNEKDYEKYKDSTNSTHR